MVVAGVGLASSAAASAGQFSAQGPLHIDLPPASLSKVYRVMPLASTKVLPFGVSVVFSICADAADDAKMKLKAAIAANVFDEILDIAALLLMRNDEDADASPRQTPEPEIYSADGASVSQAVSPQLYFRKRA